MTDNRSPPFFDADIENCENIQHEVSLICDELKMQAERIRELINLLGFVKTFNEVDKILEGLK